MNKKTVISLMLAAAIVAVPFSAARAQNPYYYANPYYANPLFWPFLAAGAILGTAALIVTAPVRIVCSTCLPPAESFYPFYTVPPAPRPAGPPMIYTPAR